MMKKIFYLCVLGVFICSILDCRDVYTLEDSCRTKLSIILIKIITYHESINKWPWKKTDSNIEMYRRLEMAGETVKIDYLSCPASDLRKNRNEKILEKNVSYIYRTEKIPKTKKPTMVPILADKSLSYHENFVLVSYLKVKNGKIIGEDTNKNIKKIYGESVSEITKKEPALGDGTFVQNLKP